MVHRGGVIFPKITKFLSKILVIFFQSSKILLYLLVKLRILQMQIVNLMLKL